MRGWRESLAIDATGRYDDDAHIGAWMEPQIRRRSQSIADLVDRSGDRWGVLATPSQGLRACDCENGRRGPAWPGWAGQAGANSGGA